METEALFSDWLRQKLQSIYGWVFFTIPYFCILLGGIALFHFWFQGAHDFHAGQPRSFQLTNFFVAELVKIRNPESAIIEAVSLYLLFLNVLRYWLVKNMSVNPHVALEPPWVTSGGLERISAMVLLFYGAFFALWIPYGEKPGYTNYWMISGFLCLAAFSLFITKFEWLYGLDASQRQGTQVTNGPKAQGAVTTDVARKETSVITFADIIGNTAIKRRLLDAAKAITTPKEDGAPKRNGILLFGEPGNGKTVFAEALAGELKLPILKLTHADVASRWVGERTEKIKEAFDQAARTQPCVLFIDEIDSFLPERSSGESQVKEDTDVVNALLTLMVDVRKLRVVLVAATNFMDRLDGAAVREGRFDFKVEISPPDEEARIGLLSSGLKQYVNKATVDRATIMSVAQRGNGYSVTRRLAVTEELPSYLSEKQEAGTPRKKLEFEDFMAALRRIQGRKGATPENVKPMNELILPPQTTEALTMLSSRMRDPQRVERLGGTLPSGVLFYGPPGTGKTAAVKALAKEVDWAFLVATGNDLSRDPKALEKLQAKAKELRPCIIFIDEADDLLRSREYSANTEATNKLLTLMDGVNDRVKDLVWIAATNHPDQIDPALLRGGRFTEKVGFIRPSENQLASHTAMWLQARNIGLARGLDAGSIAALVGDESIANLEAILQYAVNRAISTSVNDDRLVLSLEDVKSGAKMVLGSGV